MHFFAEDRARLGNMPMFIHDSLPCGVLPSWQVAPEPDGSYRLLAYFYTGSGIARQIHAKVSNEFDLGLFFHYWKINPEAVALIHGWAKNSKSPAPKARTATIDINLADLDLGL